jgi:5'-deoxynucleotidase YfbR-like HD superfamily hydrolase
MFENEVKLFMLFDILGDTVRSGMIQWNVDRERLEDVKDHIMDLIFIAKILERYLSPYVDMSKVINYIIVHDLPEAITGDITKFEGVSEEEIERVTKLAIDYLVENFNDLIDFKNLIPAYEERRDLESKVVKMIDKIHSSTTFIKYEAEKHIDMDNPDIIESLRYHPFVDEMYNKGYDVADIFYEFHRKALSFSDDELIKYNISRDDADKIVFALRSFHDEFYKQKLSSSLFNIYKERPKSAMKYNRLVKEMF